MLQVVYLLEANATCKVRLITTTHAKLTLLEVGFSLDSLILVLWENETEGFEFHVHDCSGQRLAHFQDADLAWVHAYSRPGSFACAMGGTVAVAHRYNFDVRDLRSGRLLGTLGPGMGPKYTNQFVGMVMSQVIANKDWVHSGVLRLSGAGRLPVQCSFTGSAGHLSPRGTAFQVRAAVHWQPCREHSVGRRLHGGFRQPPSAGSLPLARARLCDLGLHFLTIQPGTSSLAEKLRCGNKHPLQAAVSPGGTFVSVYEQGTASLAIWETRSGQLVHGQLIRIVPSLQNPDKALASADLRWSDLGHRLLVRLTSGGEGKMMDQVMVLHF